MSKLKKRIIALGLSLVMVLAMIPMLGSLALADEAAGTITVCLTVSNEGELAKAKDGSVMGWKPVTVTDLDEDGKFSYDEALVAAHAAYNDPEGYVVEESDYGAYVTSLWGVAKSNLLFFANNKGLTVGVGDSFVEDGDYLVASINKDDTYYSDYYSYFDKNTVTALAGTDIALTLSAFSAMAGGNPIALQGAQLGYYAEGQEEPEISFNDVKEGEWFYDYVMDIAKTKNVNGTSLMSGYKDGSGNFGPADPTQRQDFAMILYRLADEPDVAAGKNPYPDADADGYYFTAALWANANKIITGYDDGRFGIGDNVTREQVATILYRYAKFKEMDTSAAEAAGDLSKFSDKAAVSQFATKALTWAAGAGIIKGKDDGRIDPQGNAARAEIATMILRFLEYTSK